jgi:uncharacterized protein YndB with AHSA1/START domain
MSAANSDRGGMAEAETLVIERVFDAPRELVFEAWTTPELLLAWFAPRGCTIRFASIDVRPGGRFHSCIHNPAFGECWCVGEYLEVVRPQRIVYSSALADRDGNRIDAAQAGHHADWPRETIVRVTFEEEGGRTRLQLRQNASLALAKQTGAYPSWLEMLDALERELRTAGLTTEFLDAP